MSPFTPTLRLHDRYVLRERIGLGGMSEVWRADDPVLHRPVAVKALAAQLATDPELRAAIQREARAAARLTHPNVTRVYDYGEAPVPGGAVVPYLVMELVDGHSLADRLAGGPLPWPEAVRTAGEVAAALAAAHRIGVVHRDVKPANVMLTETGAKVLDFGIAALAGPHPGAGQPGELMMGTPAYVPPERMTPGPPDPAADVYALGALLYRALSGRAPLPVQTWEDAIEVHGRRTPVPPLRVPGLPAELAELTLSCLSVDPAGRPSADQLAHRLRAGLSADRTTAALPVDAVPDRPPATHPPTLVDRSTAGPPQGGALPAAVDPVPPRPGRPTDRSNRAVGVLVAAGSALIVGLVGVLALDDDPAPVRTPVAPVGAAPAQKPTPTRQPDRPRPAPSTTTTAPSRAERPAPRTAEELADAFAGVLSRAQATGTVDRKTAEELRRAATSLAQGRPKDRAKRLRELERRIDERVGEDRIDGTVAADLRDLLAVWPRTREDG